MSKKIKCNDPIRAAKRKSVAERRVGIGSRCACGESRPMAVIAGSDPMTCAECSRRQKGQSTLDDHHTACEANHSATIPVPANDHRAILSEAQYDWPKATRENPDGSPLRAIAGCIRGVCDTIIYLIDRLLLWGAEFVEKLDDFLIAQFGPKWWTSAVFLEFMKGTEQL